MDKKVTRQYLSQPPSFSSGHPNFQSRDSGRNKSQQYGYHKRSGYHGNPQKSNYGSSNHNQRKYDRLAKDPEVKDEKDKSCVTSNTSTEKSAKHGVNANHLLNFSYSPLRSQEPGWRGGGSYHPGRRPVKSRGPVITKEQFLQANCQFVVRSKPADNAQFYMADADTMVDWDLIEQVRLTDDQLAICPICLDVPVAAKITKCAHIYCWPCILHYLSLSDRAWAKCPICFDAVEQKDLKSISSRMTTRFNVGDEITLTLMKRERGSLYVRPCGTWNTAGASQLFGLYDAEDDIMFSKVLTACPDQLAGILAEERRQLMRLMDNDDTETLEASFVRAALDNVNERERRLVRAKPAAPPPTIAKADTTDHVTLFQGVPDQILVKHDVKLEKVTYTDAFDDVLGEASTNEKCSAPKQEFSTPVNPQSLTPSANDDSPVYTAASPPQDSTRARSGNSISSTDSGESELVAANLTLPPTGTQPPQGSRRTEVYYFYQAADGQRVYLHSLNTRMLAAQYGSLELAPRSLTATIVEAESNSMSPELRKKLKYLSHLPLYSQFTVCELALRPPAVSSAVLAHFADEVAKRKKARNRRQRVENRQYHRAVVEERRKQGKFPDMYLPLQSDLHFPSNANDQDYPVPSREDGNELVCVQTAQGLSSSDAAAATTGSAPITSSAQTIASRDGTSTAVPNWPRVNSNVSYVRSSVTSVSAKTKVDDEESEETSAPSFQESFTADLTQLTTAASVSSNQSGQGNGKGKKKQKNKKTVVLFNTSGHRANP